MLLPKLYSQMNGLNTKLFFFAQKREHVLAPSLFDSLTLLLALLIRLTLTNPFQYQLKLKRWMREYRINVCFYFFLFKFHITSSLLNDIREDSFLDVFVDVHLYFFVFFIQLLENHIRKVG